VSRTLRKQGWTVVRLWEHDLRNSIRCTRRIRKALNDQSCRARNVK
jgi:G:T-mismatch repair DNA endonuclease (very short patch repair protein)